MALGDYEKTTYVEGSPPGISAIRLNRNENKTKELDDWAETHEADDVQVSNTGQTEPPHGLPKCKYDATTAPTADNDSTQGYSVGSKWFDITSDKAYECLDATAGAAVWKSSSGEVDIHKEESSHIGKNKQVKVYNATNQSIPNSTYTKIAFGGEYYDNANQHDNTTNNTRLTCVETGRYLVHATVTFDTNATGIREVQFKINNSAIDGRDIRQAVTGSIVVITLSTIRQLSANDYVELEVNQTSGGGLNVLGTGATIFGMVRVG